MLKVLLKPKVDEPVARSSGLRFACKTTSGAWKRPPIPTPKKNLVNKDSQPTSVWWEIDEQPRRQDQEDESKSNDIQVTAGLLKIDRQEVSYSDKTKSMRHTDSQYRNVVSIVENSERYD